MKTVFIVLPVMALAIVGIGWAKTTPKPKPTSVTIPFEVIGLFDPLPAYVRDAPLEYRVKWLKAYNEEVVRRARQQADAFNARHPAPDTYVQEQDYTSASSLDQTATAGYDSAQVQASATTRYCGRNTQRVFRATPYGGGPVVILNPYMSQDRGGDDDTTRD